MCLDKESARESATLLEEHSISFLDIKGVSMIGMHVKCSSIFNGGFMDGGIIVNWYPFEL